MKTLLDILNEAKIDNEYEKNYSSFMPRDIFNAILKIDPKTTVVDGEPQGLGFVAKNLLLPAYISGETDFVENGEDVKKLISNYYNGIVNYPKPKEFKSVNDFITFMQDPDNADIEINKIEEQNPIDNIYNKYWTKIPRDEFDIIISLDPETTQTKIGEIAKNLLLPKYSAGEHWILDDEESKEKVKDAIKRFTEEKISYETEKQNIHNYESVKDFVEYVPVSPIVAETPHLKEGQDFIYIASTPEYDVFKPLNFKASRDLAHTNNSRNVWCTAGGSDGTRYNVDREGVGEYWKSYYVNGGKDIYEFIYKPNPQDIRRNYNMALRRSDGEITEFRDGNNQNSGSGNNPHKNLFISFLLANPMLVDKLVKSSDKLISSNSALLETQKLIELQSKPLVINNNIDQYQMLSADDNLKQSIRKVEIYNVEEVLPQLFAECRGIEEVIIQGPKVIGIEAFKSCTGLVKLTLDAPLEKIEDQAFSNCVSLHGSVRLPDTLTSIGEKAFNRTHCTLKVNRDRTSKLKFNLADKDWVNSHVESIKLG